MRVLLTGHAGYIGTVMSRCCRSGDMTSSGCDSDLFDESTYGDDPVAIPALDKDIRDVAARPTSTASTRSSISPGSRTIRWAT